MCGRYYIDIAKDELSFVNNFSEIEYEQNFNVAPQNQAPCIIDNNLVIANWGYFPDWLKSQSNPRPLFNTRYESLLEKKTFTSAFKNSRCLIPISITMFSVNFMLETQLLLLLSVYLRDLQLIFF